MKAFNDYLTLNSHAFKLTKHQQVRWIFGWERNIFKITFSRQSWAKPSQSYQNSFTTGCLNLFKLRCSSLKRCLTMLWCHKVWLYSLCWSAMTVVDQQNENDSTLRHLTIVWHLFGDVVDQHNEYNQVLWHHSIVWGLFGYNQTSKFHET